MDIDIKQAMAKQEGGTGRVIPIIVHPVPWQLAPFGRLQALPKDAKPISTWPKEYEAWFDVVKGIKETAEELSRSTTLPSRTRNKEADESTGLSHRLSLRDLSLRDKFLMGFFEEPRGPQQEE